MVLFKSKRAFDKGIWDNQVRWLKLSIPDEKVDPPNSLIADDGGFAIIRCSDIFISLRYPRFKFRPSQNDMLHLDLWINGENILRDGGSYSYNSDSRLMNYFGSISGHNTIQFDNHEPMEKISRFLYVNWLKTNWIEKFANIDGKLSFGAGYTDIFGVKHKRKVDLLQDKLVVTDDITNFKINAIQRWRLIDSDWEFVEKNDKNIFLRSNSKKLFIHVSCTENITNSELTEGLESLFYMKTNNLPVLEVTVVKKCIITTTVSW
jgi:hypothetical protein